MRDGKGGPEEKKLADEKMTELRGMLAKLDECDDITELAAQLKININPNTITEEPEQDMNFPDVLIPYEELVKMDEKDIMAARSILSVKYADKPVKIAYGLQTPLTHIDYVAEKIAALDYVTLDRPEPRFLIVTNKNAANMKDKTFLSDMAGCLCRIYYVQIEKLREKKEEKCEVHITSILNLFEYVKSKGYNATKLTATTFSVTFD